MKKRTKKEIITKGNEIALSIADSFISSFIMVSPFQTGAAIKSAYASIKEEMFNEKLEMFLTETAGVSKEERKAFLVKIKEDKDRFFKRLISILDRLDDERKSKYIGKIFKQVLKGKFDPDEFLELSAMIDQTFLSSIDFLLRYYKDDKSPNIPFNTDYEITKKNLTANGFLIEGVTTGNDPGQVHVRHLISPMGKSFVKICGSKK